MKLKYRGGSALDSLVRKMRTGGTGDPIPRASNAEGVNFEEGKKGYSDYVNDPEFQDWLGKNRQYYPEYSGEALKTGGGSGSVRKALGDTPYAEMAVNPDLLPMESGYGREEYGFSSPGAARSTRGGQMQQAADMFRNNRQMEVDYEAWLAKQRKMPGRGQVTERAESRPGQSDVYVRRGPGSAI